MHKQYGINTSSNVLGRNKQIVAVSRILSFSFLGGSVGILSDLLLMNHYENFSQILPILLISVCLILFLATLLIKTKRISNFFKCALALLTICAFAGIYFHLRGKADFKIEIDPNLKGWNLFLACITGHSLPPVLAPASIILVALSGYAWALVNTYKSQLKNIDDHQK